jgi:hypothetical protein
MIDYLSEPGFLLQFVKYSNKKVNAILLIKIVYLGHAKTRKS